MTKSTWTCTCKLCSQQYEVSSTFWPISILEHFTTIQFFLHIIRKHFKEMKLAHWLHGFKHCFLLIIKTIWFFVLGSVMLALYPLYWLLVKLYE